MNFKNDCIEITKRSKIKCEGHKRKIIFKNLWQKSITKIKVDGCQITEGLKCDYLIIYKNYEYFVELKGHDLRHAFKQLIRTINLLGDNNCIERYSYVISSRSPLTSAEIQNYRIKFKRKYKSNLIVKNNNHEVILQ